MAVPGRSNARGRRGRGLATSGRRIRIAPSFPQTESRYALRELRQASSSKSNPDRPLVAILADGASVYGRNIFRGVTRYANLQRRWVLHVDLRLDALLEHFPECDGVIMAGVGGAVRDELLRRARFGIHCSGSGDPTKCPLVSLDEEAVGAMAAGHLRDCQLGRFAFYGVAPTPASTVAGARLRGFRGVLQAHGQDCDVCPVPSPARHEWLAQAHHPALIAWLRSLPKPVGVFAADDTLAHDLSIACLEADLAVPESVAIIGVNNDELLCESAWPPLSSVNGEYSRVGYEAAKRLDRMFRGEDIGGDERWLRLPPVGVVQRQSTSILAVDDPHLAEALRFIREHACDPCNVGDVLEHVPVGRRWLERQFKTQLGRTPHDEIMRVRTDTARRLLLQPDLTIADISYRCGFSAVQNFTQAFREAAGATPAAYRRKLLPGGVPTSTE